MLEEAMVVYGAILMQCRGPMGNSQQQLNAQC
jgi:hypothetical protein